MAKRSSIRSKMYSFGSFSKFILATGKETSARLKYWAPKYFDVEAERWELLCVCNHKLTSHFWELGLGTKWAVIPKDCLKKNCRCGLGTQDNFKFIENLRDE